MTTGRSHDPADPFRTRARRLLRQLRAGSEADVRAAAERLRRLRSFASLSIDELIARADRVRLKHALAVVAHEEGYGSWLELKAASSAGAPDPPMYVSGFDVLLNRWFARYEEARASLDEQGGYLLPFRTQFVVCESEGIRLLGLDPDDPDWERIGRDWVRPADRDAWQRLCAKRVAVVGREERPER